MTILQYNWTNFKAAINAGIPFTWDQSTDRYILYAYNGGFQIRCVLIPNRDGEIEDFEANYKNKSSSDVIMAIHTMPFTSKSMGIKRLFKRAHGVSQSVTTGANTIDFLCPYPIAKIAALQIINGEIGDTIDFMIHDTLAGTISGTSRALLNQFAFNLNVAPVMWEWTSSYEEDLIQDLMIRLSYNSASGKTVRLNFDLNEVK